MAKNGIKVHWIVVDGEGAIVANDVPSEKKAIAWVKERYDEEDYVDFSIYRLTHECCVIESDPEICIDKAG